MLGRSFKIFERSGIFLAQIVFISDSFVQIRNQRPKIDPYTKFQPKLDKRIPTSNDSENYLITSSNFLMPLSDFVPDYHLAKFGGDWTTDKGEKAYILPEYPPPPHILPK